MIFVRRDPTLIPEKVLKVAEQAQQRLESLPEAERAAFIEKKSHVWRAFARYLRRMSYGKCWYSESPEVQSFFDVDHYRPKLEAKRSETETDPGYEWLTFSWENFRLSAQRSNRLSTNEDTDETEGKSSWFPLLDGSPKACWNQRCIDQEKPILLDPTKRADVRLIEIMDDGRMGPSRFCISTANKIRVEKTVKYLGLDLPALKEARLGVMRDIRFLVEDLAQLMDAAVGNDTIADVLPLDGKLAKLQEKVQPNQPYVAAARAELRRQGFGELCVQPEEVGA